MKVCSECGKELSKDTTTCPNCGCPISQEDEEPKTTVEKYTVNKTSKVGKIVMGIFFGVIIVGTVVMFIDNNYTNNNVGSSIQQESNNNKDDTDINDNNTTKEVLYKISVDKFDYFSESLAFYSEEYTGKLDGQSIKAKVNLSLEDNNSCYLFNQMSFDNGAVTTIQGDCTYSIQGNKLSVDGEYNKLEVPSAEEQSYGVSSTTSKETSHLEFEINKNGQSLTAGKITYYNSTYTRIFKRYSDYFLIDKNKKLYDENGKELWSSNENDTTKYNSIDLSKYNIIEVEEMPY